MKEFQKIIKYLAIAFGIYLAVNIIAGIIGVVVTVCTGIYGIHQVSERISEIPTKDIIREVENISILDVDLATSNISIKSTGEEFKIEAYNVPETVKIEENNGTLRIKNNIKKLKNNLKEGNITLFVPEGFEFENIDLDIGAGTVNIENTNTNNIHFSFGAGDVKINNIVANKSKIECGTGQVVIQNSELTDADIDTGVGKLEFSGYLKGNSKIDCGIGEIKIDLKGGSEIYSIDAEKGVGNITINENKISNDQITGNGPNKIDIDGGIGNIDIKM